MTRALNPLGMAHSFVVVVAGISLGSWSKIAGLSVNWDPIEYRTGNYNQVTIYAGAAKYARLKMSRAASRDSTTVQRWLATCTRTPRPQTGTIRLFGAGQTGGAIVTWQLRGVVPLGWNVTDFDAGSSKVAMETLEIAHTGFLNDVIRRT